MHTDETTKRLDTLLIHIPGFTFKGQPLKNQYDRKSQLTADRVDL